jgi:hypothetical protein
VAEDVGDQRQVASVLPRETRRDNVAQRVRGLVDTGAVMTDETNMLIQGTEVCWSTR